MLGRIVKLACSAAVWLFDLSRFACRRLFARERGSIGTIVYFHSVFAEERGKFARLLDRLQRGTTLVHLDAPMRCPRHRYCVALTFDDAFTSFRDHALPELLARRIPFAVFAPAGRLGGEPTWLLPASRSYGRERVMTAHDLAALDPALATIGSHGVAHRRLTELPAEEAQRELRDSRLALEACLARPVRFFSFPYGACNAAAVELARDAGYARVFTSRPARAPDADDDFVAGRIAVEPSDWPCELFLKARGAYRWLPWAWRAKGWARRVCGGSQA
jgi:peptidoglycan/xylan/chitin deacetylase (PgdA/CDA1 family)